MVEIVILAHLGNSIGTLSEGRDEYICGRLAPDSILQRAGEDRKDGHRSELLRLLCRDLIYEFKVLWANYILVRKVSWFVLPGKDDSGKGVGGDDERKQQTKCDGEENKSCKQKPLGLAEEFTHFINTGLCHCLPPVNTWR